LKIVFICAYNFFDPSSCPFLAKGKLALTCMRREHLGRRKRSTSCLFGRFASHTGKSKKIFKIELHEAHLQITMLA